MLYILMPSYPKISRMRKDGGFQIVALDQAPQEVHWNKINLVDILESLAVSDC
jgi:hypothetical protein